MTRSGTAAALALSLLLAALAFVYRKPTRPAERLPWEPTTPFPTSFRIEPPYPGAPAAAAALSGVWQGLWDLGDGRYLPTTIAVERIEPGQVSAIYSWGSAPWNPPPSMAPGWIRVTGRLDGETMVLHWGAPPEDFTVTLRPSRNDRAVAEYSWTAYHATALLDRVP